MTKSTPWNNCTLSDFERRLYCGKKSPSKECTKLRILGYRCPYLIWSKTEVMMKARKGAKEIVSKSGFSDDALEYAEKFRPHLKLVHGEKIVKPRRRRVLAHASK